MINLYIDTRKYVFCAIIILGHYSFNACFLSHKKVQVPASVRLLLFFVIHNNYLIIIPEKLLVLHIHHLVKAAGFHTLNGC